MPISKVESIRLEYTCCRSSLAHLTPVSLSFELGNGGIMPFYRFRQKRLVSQ